MIKSLLEKNHIIPDLFDSLSEVCAVLRVSYHGRDLTPGSELSTSTVKTAPKVVFPDSKGFKHLILLDPDAPSHKDHKFRSWLHWLVINVPINGSLDDGDTVVGYAGATPPKGTGHHRYVFATFETENKIHVKAPEERGKFNIKTFIDSHHLGLPRSCNFFLAEHE